MKHGKTQRDNSSKVLSCSLFLIRHFKLCILFAPTLKAHAGTRKQEKASLPRDDL